MQPGLHPIELLFDVEKLLRVNSVSHIVLGFTVTLTELENRSNL
jgi:hypothetical protein